MLSATSLWPDSQRTVIRHPTPGPVTISCPESISSSGGALGTPSPIHSGIFTNLVISGLILHFVSVTFFLLLHWSFSNYRSWSQGVTACFPPSQLKYLHSKETLTELSHFEVGTVCFLDSSRNHTSFPGEETSEVICSSPEATAFWSHRRAWSQGWEASEWRDRNQSRREATSAVIQKSEGKNNLEYN